MNENDNRKLEYEELYREGANVPDAALRLYQIVCVLREKCPWDSIQTHESLCTCMIEEAYEAVDAIQKNDTENLREELGDVLLQVVLNGIISEGDGEFTLTDVINDECEKMIRRHPHIFNESGDKPIDKVLERWENVKSKEHGDSRYSDRLKSVPDALPALMRAGKVQKRAAQIVRDYSDTDDAMAGTVEAIERLKESLSCGDQARAETALGDALFSLTGIARVRGIDPEAALNRRTSEFVTCFESVEESVRSRGADMRALQMKDLNKRG